MPRNTIPKAFINWKLLLLAITLLTPGPYDTSTSQILPAPRTLLQTVLQKLTRWDAIYFVKAAQRDYANEQEWAFGYGFVKAINGVHWLLSPVFKGLDLDLPQPYAHALSAVLIANLSHALSTAVLYKLTREVFPSNRRLPRIAALLHIISPAGLFLSAPYSESLFALLTFVGLYCYVRGYVVVAGAWMFAATMVRSNGLLNGAVFLFDFWRVGCGVLTGEGRSWRAMGRLVGLGIGGVLVGAGLVVPQWVAYGRYCLANEDVEVRSWCNNTLPSIYFFVQERYWNVGLFRYWTLPNIPLFLLATPALIVLICSGIWALYGGAGPVVKKLAVPQVLLAVMALLTYHVQIITRLSSGCVVWYWWVACMICVGDGRAKWIVRWMVCYALVQGVLFAGFLPPA
ncbi:mannosyltransferase [Choiromyces venosus 120613-1]|uniref:GPI mannosyltransferase 2 n=1 Tax=Choiromyces venosus 120613-1 TaxID=1336337 RepID=A0A3N4IWW2_9PEZI|nr:mannosyltransferase [Choiromyces venosus 120613-1]